MSTLISIVPVKPASLLLGFDTVLITTAINQTQTCVEIRIGTKTLYLGLPKMGQGAPGCRIYMLEMLHVEADRRQWSNNPEVTQQQSHLIKAQVGYGK